MAIISVSSFLYILVKFYKENHVHGEAQLKDILSIYDLMQQIIVSKQSAH